MKVPLSHLISQAEGPAQVTPGGDAFTEAMQVFYTEVDAAVASHSPVCINRGHCCKFDSFGHKLYVTDVELRYFSEGMRSRWIDPTDEAKCPYQSGGRCNARERRPLGCRVFFCDPAAQGWQGGVRAIPGATEGDRRVVFGSLSLQRVVIGASRGGPPTGLTFWARSQ